MIRIAVTGGAGQIAYSLLFRLAAGELLPNEPIALHILDIPEAEAALQGILMELQDCAFELLREIKIGSDPYEIFEGVDYAFLVGAKPRLQGMERKDLLLDNGKIFKEHGLALSAVASKHVKVLVVGNPCNTNCLIAMHNAPSLSVRNFHAMTRLDQNRARAYLAEKVMQPVSCISNMTIWGNHSSTQVPDFYNAKINNYPAPEVVQDIFWLENDFVKKVQGRGAEIIKVRGKSSAASAASSAIDSMRAFITPIKVGDWFSAAVYSANNSYGIDQDLVFSLPCRTYLDEWVEVQGIPWNEYLRNKILASERELIEERELVKDLL